MFMSRLQVRCLLLIFLSISALHREVLGARNLKEKVENADKSQVLKKSSNNAANDQGFFAASKRQVPSCPDPLHNR
ncbi:hypothetical protein I3843_07G016400 [Carya illinoinensis]|uniref:Uncharacterized protein n=1 Tax=Carya illinoinensis TaxID=32201 RepID=A0A8T1PQW4_CARIL|nr:hypothetical protein CIPAW_07G017000 [Carya illinoinensis]KAG6702105.1 hypothetical protein I3842_07G017600 [Carya illinoinensis]KAG7969142.1 hypothetical protein I3843_07G016400 [Carya illinoinensis]